MYIYCETALQIFMNILAPTRVSFVLMQYVVQLDPDPDPHRKALVATWIRIYTYGHWWLPGSRIGGYLDSDPHR
jgi:hypothetical protein